MSRRIGRLTLAAAAALALALSPAGCSKQAVTSPPPPAAPVGWVLFASAGGHLCTVRMDGCLGTMFLLSGRDPRWSPDGSRVAFRGLNYSDATLFLGDLGSGAVLRSWTLARTYNAPPPEWSPRGDRILCRDAILDPAGGSQPIVLGAFQVVEGDTVYPRHVLQWAPGEGRAFALAAVHRDVADSNELFLAEVPSGRLLRRLTHDRFDETGCQVSPDGARLAISLAYWYTGVTPRLQICRIAVMALGDTVPRVVSTGTRDVNPRWLSDGRSIVFVQAASHQALMVVDPDSSGSERMLATGADGLSSPDARMLTVGQAPRPPLDARAAAPGDSRAAPRSRAGSRI
ncbi:MAG TPA: hypothetical protein VMS93_00245 [Candidatus Saccharimonadales bacterium]|nr:hypothetical protein [Candidatus Saccharimonadales bacterium]